MARIFITGSADGLGLLAAQALISLDHSVVLHARNEQRCEEAVRAAPGAETCVPADLSDPHAVRKLAADVNALGSFDAIIHNAGIYTAPPGQLLLVNTIAPYILTCLIHLPKRLIYLSSGMHLQGSVNADQFDPERSRITYSDTKLHMLMLARIIADRYPGVYANAVNPGWVPTKMGGRGAPDSLEKGYETQVWLAAGNDPDTEVSGGYFHHKQQARSNPAADDKALQANLLDACAKLSGVSLPGHTSDSMG